MLREFEKAHGIKGILVSGLIEDGKAVEADGIRFLPKPVELEKLFEAIQSLMPAD